MLRLIKEIIKDITIKRVLNLNLFINNIGKVNIADVWNKEAKNIVNIVARYLFSFMKWNPTNTIDPAKNCRIPLNINK